MEWLRSRDQRRQFEQFVAETSAGLRRTAFLLCWDAHEADDLLQLAFTTVARHWPRVSRMDNPLAYTRRVLTNAVIDAATARSRRRQELALSEVDSREPADERALDALQAVDDREQLRRALGLLTARQRAVLVLRFWDDLTEQDVAEVLGCSVGTVKSTASRALAQLRVNLIRTG